MPDEEFLALDAALDRLAEFDARAVEVVKLCFLRPVEPRGGGTITRPGTNVTELAATAPQGAIPLSLQGTVEVARKGSTEWVLAKTNMVLTAGDRLRTGGNSRASLRFSDLSIVRIRELTHLEIQPPGTNRNNPSLKLKGGTIEFFDRGPRSNSIVTPVGSVRIRG